MKHRLLIVEDDREFLATLRDLFDCSGFEVQTALNGKEALGLLQAESFDIVLTDIQMPEMNGIELLSTLGKLDMKLPKLYVMTGGTPVSDKDIYSKGVEKIYKKPFDFRAVVREFLLLAQAS